MHAAASGQEPGERIRLVDLILTVIQKKKQPSASSRGCNGHEASVAPRPGRVDRSVPNSRIPIVGTY